MKVTVKEAIDLIKDCIGDDQDFCVAKNFKSSSRRKSSIQFTINVLSLDLLFSMMELDEVENVYFHPSSPPTRAHMYPTAMRYRVYVEFVDLVESVD